MKELHVLGAFVHGVLTGLHALGIAYNVRRVQQGSSRNWFDIAMHSGALLYSAHAAMHHVHDTLGTNADADAL